MKHLFFFPAMFGVALFANQALSCEVAVRNMTNESIHVIVYEDPKEEVSLLPGPAPIFFSADRSPIVFELDSRNCTGELFFKVHDCYTERTFVSTDISVDEFKGVPLFQIVKPRRSEYNKEKCPDW